MKKTFLGIISILVTIIILILSAMALGCKSDEERLIEYTEGTDKYAKISHQYVVSSNVSQEAKEMVEIKYEIDQGQLDLEVLAIGLTLYNNSKDRTIERAYVSMNVLDDKGKVIWERTKILGDTHGAIGPGEAHKSPYLFTAYLEYLVESPSKFVIILEQVDLTQINLQ